MEEKILLKCTLPYPPTINDYYKNGSLAVTYKPNQYGQLKKILYRKKIVDKSVTSYKKKVSNILMYEKQITCPIKLTIFAFPPDKRIRDTDNILKGLFDALQYSQIIKNDFQIEHHQLIRIYDNKFKNTVFLTFEEIRENYVQRFKYLFGIEVE